MNSSFFRRNNQKRIGDFAEGEEELKLLFIPQI
jgi:hypothetical protein